MNEHLKVVSLLSSEGQAGGPGKPRVVFSYEFELSDVAYRVIRPGEIIPEEFQQFITEDQISGDRLIPIRIPL